MAGSIAVVDQNRAVMGKRILQGIDKAKTAGNGPNRPPFLDIGDGIWAGGRSVKSCPKHPHSRSRNVSWNQMDRAESGKTRRKASTTESSNVPWNQRDRPKKREKRAKKTSTTQSWNVSCVQQHKPKAGARPKLECPLQSTKVGLHEMARKGVFVQKSGRNRQRVHVRLQRPFPETKMSTSIAVVGRRGYNRGAVGKRVFERINAIVCDRGNRFTESDRAA